MKNRFIIALVLASVLGSSSLFGEVSRRDYIDNILYNAKKHHQQEREHPTNKGFDAREGADSEITTIRRKASETLDKLYSKKNGR